MTPWISRSLGGAWQREKAEIEPTGLLPARRAGSAIAVCLLLVVLASAAPEPAAPRDTLDLGDQANVRALAFSPDGKMIAVHNASRGYSLTLWDVESKKQVAALKSKNSVPGILFAFTSDGGSLLALALGGTGPSYRLSVAVWDTKTYALNRTVDLELDYRDMQAAAFTADGKWLIVGTRSFGVWIFDLKTGKQTNDLQFDERPQVSEILAMALVDRH